MPDNSDDSLDPKDWQALRAQGHRMLDDMVDYLEHLRERPVWQAIPPDVRNAFRESLPLQPTALEDVHQRFMQDILPYVIGNAHPGFMGWVQGGGTPVGMLAEMLAAGLNANVGGREQMPVEVERQVLQWVRELFGFPDTASGLFVTGSSMANLISVLVARTAALGTGVRRIGLTGDSRRLCAYTSAGAHGCIAQAMDLSGLGIDALRMIPLNANYQMDLDALQRAIAKDRSAGMTPFFVAGTAGTVDVGAVDDLAAIAEIAQREALWFHVDGAYGALAMLAPEIAPRLTGIERADSVAVDFHKWAQVQYDAGFILVRDGAMHQSTFAAPVAYLRRDTRGMAANSPWPCDFGPDLSRSFKALKTWFTIKVYGTEKLGQVISNTCALARYLQQCVTANPMLELLAPVSLNIVCFRYRCNDPDRINADIVVALQESGIVAPSATTIDGRLAIRAAFVNHRTTRSDVDALINATLAFGEAAVKQTKEATMTSNARAASPSDDDSQAPLIGLAPLMRQAFAGIDIKPLGTQLIERAAIHPDDAHTLMDLSTVLQLIGNRELALATQAQALEIQPLYSIPAASGEPSIRLLAIMAPGDLMANTPLEFLLENSDVHLDMLYMGAGVAAVDAIPEHDVLFIAVGESDENRALLTALESLTEVWPRPMLNAPQHIANLSRDGASRLLESAPGVAMPLSVRIDRTTLEHIGTTQKALAAVLEDGDFPIIVRPVGSHAGQGLQKLDEPTDIAAYLQTMPASEFYIARFIDYRSPDSLFRKYRIMLIAGLPYVCHMGISTHWMIHYLNAGMTDSPQKRAEEERFMKSFDADFAPRHQAAFRAITERLGLDYVGIDCAETPDGQLLIFEVDSDMIVHAMDPVDMFPYKQPQMRKLFDAFRAMLEKAAAR